MFTLAGAGVTVTMRSKGRRVYREPLCRTATYYRSAVPYLTRLLNSNK